LGRINDAMNYIQILILALIQGAAELLPVSSSAHVILAAKLMGYEDTSSSDFVFMLVMLHTGTMFAVLYYFWPRWRRLLSAKSDSVPMTNHSPFTAPPSPSVGLVRGQFFKMIALATACTGVLGLGLKLFIEKVVLVKMLGREKGEVEDLFKSLPLMGAALFLVGLFIIFAGLAARRREARGLSGAKQITPRVSIWIGLVQGLCLPFRGFSRSGATISTALCAGVDRMLAEDFSFALAVVITPSVIVLELYRLLTTHHSSLTNNDTHLADLLLPGMVGMVFSFGAGLVALHILSAALEKGRWKYFGYYCILFSLVVLYAAHKGY
jgi:undecaprenyl-diphosphatase